MLTTIKKATENFCIHQIRELHQTIEGISKKRTLIAYIDIDAQDGTSHRVYIASDEAFMQRVSYLFLEEEKSDEDTLIDMTLETANLIIGSAKVIAEEIAENPYTIGTPHFVKLGIFDLKYDSAHTIIINEDEITIAIKELHD
ncbi:chemotaxis protein CheX [Sulfurimonas sp. SAG-AH-194-C21]|nr:chemotaxis protein CheX [Sulfurimonas sp. SAG-AH-194-C21]MDF1884139.1 chemotaxis protein CheX [Sulfurimonas sp. SAG-AH-194-C21]